MCLYFALLAGTEVEQQALGTLSLLSIYSQLSILCEGVFVHFSRVKDS